MVLWGRLGVLELPEFVTRKKLLFRGTGPGLLAA